MVLNCRIQTHHDGSGISLPDLTFRIEHEVPSIWENVSRKKGSVFHFNVLKVFILSISSLICN